MTAAAMTAAETAMAETPADDVMTAKATAVPRASDDDDAATVATVAVAAVAWAVSAVTIGPVRSVCIPSAAAIRAPTVALISGVIAAAQTERHCDHERRE